MNFANRMQQSALPRPVGTRGGRGVDEGALCLSSWQHDSSGFREADVVYPRRGQAQGPLIHPILPIVPTEDDPIPPFGWQN